MTSTNFGQVFFHSGDPGGLHNSYSNARKKAEMNAPASAELVGYTPYAMKRLTPPHSQT